MVAITYSLTPVDYDEIEKERRGGIARRIVRIIFGALAGFVGVYMICQVIVFPWKNHPLGSLLFLAMGLFCLWGGLEMPGLYPLLVCLSDPFAPRELRIDDKSITWRCGSRLQQSRWRPGRGFMENEKFFFLRALRDEGTWAIPKSQVTREQELNLREIVRRASAET